MRVKRSKYVGYYIVDGYFPDLASLITAGRFEIDYKSAILATSSLTGSEMLISIEHFARLSAISSKRWEICEFFDSETLLRFAKVGLLLVDLDADWAVLLRKREEVLDRTFWHARSAVFHFLSKWRDVKLFPPVPLDHSDPYTFSMEKLQEGAKPYLDSEPCPSPFWEHPDTKMLIPLDDHILSADEGSIDGGFINILIRRSSIRQFDPTQSIDFRRFSTLLYYAFYPLAKAESVYTALHKTSPSGGGLHPTEAFVLVKNVDGLSPGLYHYNIKRNALELISELSSAEAKRKALLYVAQQPYVLHSSAVIILASRFYRNHWKYRRNDRTYLVMAMDIGHLGQTLYLLTTKLGLAGFFTAAVNAWNIEDDLKIDGTEIGVMAAYVLGVKHSNAMPEFPPPQIGSRR